MGLSRQCTKTGCVHRAVATLTYVYGDQTAVLGPLATYAEPHTYDLCAAHASGLTAPRGWHMVRLTADADLAPAAGDDLLALADAVRETSRVPAAAAAPDDLVVSAGRPEGRARGHLRVLRNS